MFKRYSLENSRSKKLILYLHVIRDVPSPLNLLPFGCTMYIEVDIDVTHTIKHSLPPSVSCFCMYTVSKQKKTGWWEGLGTRLRVDCENMSMCRGTCTPWVHRRDHVHCCVHMYLRVVKLLHAIGQFLSDRLHQRRNYYWVLLVPEMVLAEEIVTVLLGESSGLNHSDLHVHVRNFNFVLL